MEKLMSERQTVNNEPAYERLIACINDEDLYGRYPTPTHFIAATNPEHGQMVLEAIAEGGSVALIYEDGHEVFARNEDGSITVEERDENARPIAA
jgi:hypothetical protein